MKQFGRLRHITLFAALFALGEVEGEPVVIVVERGADTWTARSVIPVRHDWPTD